MDATPLPPPQQADQDQDKPPPQAGTPAEPAEPDRPTVTLAGRFQLSAEFQDTPTGRLHHAVDTTTGAQVLVKVAAASAFPSPMLVDRTLRELRQLSKVTSPRVMKVIAHGRAQSSPAGAAMAGGSGEVYVAFEPPPDGAEVLDEIVGRQGILAPDRARAIVLQIGEALADAHQAGVVHRNIAPHTVYLLPNDQVLVVDFGLTEVHEVKGRIIQGSPHYLSPEQAEGKSVDQRSSIYSLAAIYYYLLTGTPPLQGASLAEVMTQVTGTPPPPASIHRAGLPPALDRLLARALEKASGRRHVTLRQFINEIEELGSIAPPAAPADPIAVKPYRSPTRTLILGGPAAQAQAQAAKTAQAQTAPPAGRVGAPSAAPAPSAPPRPASAVPSTPPRPASAAPSPSAPPRPASAAPAAPAPPAAGERPASGDARHARTLVGLPVHSSKGVSPTALGAAFSGAGSPSRPPAVPAAPPPAEPAPAAAASPPAAPEEPALGEEGATIPMPRMTEEELMATFGLDVPLRDAAAAPAPAAAPAAAAPQGPDLHTRPTEVQRARVPIAERETVRIPPSAVPRTQQISAAPPAAPPVEPPALAEPAPAASASPGPVPPAPAEAPASIEAPAAAPEAQPAEAPASVRSTPASAASPSTFRETAWFKKGEIEDFLQDPNKGDEIPLSAEDHARLSLRKPGEAKAAGEGKAKAVIPGKQMTEAEMIEEMRGKSRLVMVALVVGVLLGVGAFLYMLLKS
jgi:serine/threonine-protein kinase